MRVWTRLNYWIFKELFITRKKWLFAFFKVKKN